MQKASLVLFDRGADGDVRVFLSRRSKDATMFPDAYSFFGGGINEGETPEEAMLREIKEELGHTPENHVYLGMFCANWGLRHVFLSEEQREVVDALQVQEGQGGRWFAVSEVLQEGSITHHDKAVIFTFSKVAQEM